MPINPRWWQSILKMSPRSFGFLLTDSSSAVVQSLSARWEIEAGIRLSLAEHSAEKDDAIPSWAIPTLNFCFFSWGPLRDSITGWKRNKISFDSSRRQQRTRVLYETGPKQLILAVIATGLRSMMLFKLVNRTSPDGPEDGLRCVGNPVPFPHRRNVLSGQYQSLKSGARTIAQW